MKIEMEIDDEFFNGINADLKEQIFDDEAKRQLLIKLAVREVSGWISGRNVYLSLTEQHTEWLMELLQIFYPDDPPSAERIFNSFSVPYGRAAYISRVLLEKQQTTWREKGRENLARGLRNKQAEAQDHIDNGDSTQYVPVSLDKISYRELSVIIDELLAEDDTIPTPVNKSTSPGRKTVDIPSQLFALIIDKIEG